MSTYLDYYTKLEEALANTLEQSKVEFEVHLGIGADMYVITHLAHIKARLVLDHKIAKNMVEYYEMLSQMEKAKKLPAH